MTKILFVCLGNICRSPMAEFVFKDMVKKRGLIDEFVIASAATSSEEVGNPVHRGTREKLKQVGISCIGKTAAQLQKSDYDRYDWLIGMDRQNLCDMRRLFDGDAQNKVRGLLDFTAHGGEIADPWYTGNFDVTYRDVVEGCEGLLDFLLRDQKG